MKTTLFLMVGYPGSGKTTAARYIHELTGAVHIWADKERKEMFGGVYRTQQSDKLYAILNKKVSKLLEKGVSVIFDTNFGLRSDRDKLRDIANRAGAETVIVWLVTDKRLSRSRIVGRVKDSSTKVFMMENEDFDRIVGKFQAPASGETPIRLRGQGLSKDIVAKALTES